MISVQVVSPCLWTTQVIRSNPAEHEADGYLSGSLVLSRRERGRKHSGTEKELMGPSTAHKHKYVWPGKKEPDEKLPSLKYINHTRSRRAGDFSAKRHGAVDARVHLGLENISQ